MTTLLRTCEYDEEVLEYWVNIRTSGELSKEDLEEISQTRQYEGEGGDSLEVRPSVVSSGFEFALDDSFIHKAPTQSEGTKPVTRITIKGQCAAVMFMLHKPLV